MTAKTVDPYNVQTILERIRKEKPGNLDDFLDGHFLPAELWQRFILIYDSRSIQRASFEWPRVVLFSPTARLIVAFNGLKDDPHYNSLEMIQFHNETNSFEFQEVEFGGSRRFHIPESNSSKCLRCHGGDTPRPNWDSYFLWPGIFGSEDDTLTVNAYAEGVERSKFDEFNKGNRLRGRYRKLIKNMAFAQYKDQFDNKVNKEARPNLVFTAELEKLNYRRLSTLILKSDKLRHWDAALLWALRCTSEDPADQSFRLFDLPLQKELSLIPSLTLRNLSEKIQRLNMDSVEARLTRQKELVTSYVSQRTYELNAGGAANNLGAFESPWILPLIYAAENAGLSTRQWSLEFKPKSYQFSHGVTSLEPLATYLTEQLVKRLNIKMDDRFCSVLRTRHEEEMKKLVFKRPSAWLNSNPFDKCISCHATQATNASLRTGTPLLPFGDLTRLRHKLVADGGQLKHDILYRIDTSVDDPEHMPQGETLSDFEKNQIREYLNSLN
jgi:hypothetical protein